MEGWGEFGPYIGIQENCQTNISSARYSFPDFPKILQLCVVYSEEIRLLFYRRNKEEEAPWKLGT